ncbi:S9 family peptidase [Brevundimonas diminuta]|uniref:S9 family peptidase n=1 Tax=Brevundimonas diminuta TaxID=293 RepID=UPI0037CC64B4
MTRPSSRLAASRLAAPLLLKAAGLLAFAPIWLTVNDARAETLNPTAAAVIAPASPLVPRALVFGSPDRSPPVINPDGGWIAFTAPEGDVMDIWIAPVDRPNEARRLTRLDRTPVQVRWARTGRHILFLKDENGDENHQLHVVDTASGEVRNLTPLAGAQARFLADSAERPDEILIGLNDRNRAFHDPVLVNILTSERSRQFENDQFNQLTADRRLNVRLGAKLADTGGQEVFRRDADGRWTPLASLDLIDRMAFAPVGFTAGQDASLVLLDGRGSDTLRLTTYDIETGRSTLMGQDDRADVSRVVVDARGAPILFATEYEKLEWRGTNPEWMAALARLTAALGPDIDILQTDADADRWIVKVESGDQPPRFFIFDLTSGQTSFLYAERAEAEAHVWSPTQPVVIPARDRHPLVSYLTLPPNTQTRDGLPVSPLPLLLIPHGGPHARDSYGFDEKAQFYASRGYAVLRVNYRGSIGFGKAFRSAAYRQWGGEMRLDLIDAVKWAIDAGVADPDKVAVSGRSAGGYLSLASLAFSPEIFACGVDTVGISDLGELAAGLPPFWKAGMALFNATIADLSTPEGQAEGRRQSPLYSADRIESPLLIIMGEADTRVRLPNAERIVEALQARDRPVTYVVFKDEGHFFSKPRNRLAEFALEEHFLGECLGGRTEPENGAVTESDAEFVVGDQAWVKRLTGN